MSPVSPCLPLRGSYPFPRRKSVFLCVVRSRHTVIPKKKELRESLEIRGSLRTVFIVALKTDMGIKDLRVRRSHCKPAWVLY